MIYLLKQTLFATFALVIAMTAAHAQDPLAANSVDDLKCIRIIDEVVPVAFEPKDIFLLLAVQPNSIIAFPLHRAPQPLPRKSIADPLEILVGTQFCDPRLMSPTVDFYYSVVALDGQGQFAATPVARMTGKELLENTKSVDTLQENIDAIKAQLSSADLAEAKIDPELAQLRMGISQLVKIDDLVQLRLMVSYLEADVAKKFEEIKRLQDLLAAGRAQGEEESYGDLRQDLSMRLRETAQVTAMADRLQNRKKRAAQTALEYKMNLIQTTQGVDPNSLAREVLRLRAERQNLERELGVAAPTENRDF